MSISIETSRCFLRPTKEKDRNDIFNLYGNEDVRRFLGGTIDEKAFHNRYDCMLLDTVALNWTVSSKENQEFMGIVSLNNHHDGENFEISYQLLPRFWGKGYATESVNAIIRYASDIMKLSNIVAETQYSNEQSKKLLEKLGMSPISIITRFGEKQVIYRKDFS